MIIIIIVHKEDCFSTEYGVRPTHRPHRSVMKPVIYHDLAKIAQDAHSMKKKKGIP